RSRIRTLWKPLARAAASRLRGVQIPVLRRVGGVGQRPRARASGFHSVRIRLLVFERPEDAIQARRETIEMILSAQVGAGSAEFTQPFLSALIEGLQIYWRARSR